MPENEEQKQGGAEESSQQGAAQEGGQEGAGENTSQQGGGDKDLFTQTQTSPSRSILEDEASKSEDALKVETILGAVAANPALANDPEVKELLNSAEKASKQGEENKDGSTEGKKEPESKGKDDNTGDTNSPDDKKKDDAGEEKKEGDEEDPFGIMSGKGEEKKEEIKSIEDLSKAIKDGYDINDVSTFLNSADKWREDSQKYSDLEKNHGNLVDGLASLPQPIKDAITAWGNAGDYEEAFYNAGNRLDFDMSFSDHDREDIVAHYFPERLQSLADKKANDENFKDEDYEERVKDLYASAEPSYKRDKEAFETQRATYLQQQQDAQKAVKDSARSSVDGLKQAYPNFSREDLQRINQRLVTGDIVSEFINKDGTYKKDAAEKLALAMFGKSVIKNVQEKAKRDAGNKATEEVVGRGNEKMKTSKKMEAQQASSTKEKDAVEHLSGMFTEDPYI